MKPPTFNDSNVLQPSNHSSCYATFLSSMDLLPAFEAFVYSLQLQGDTVTPLVVVVAYRDKAMETIGIRYAKSVLSKYPQLMWELYVLSESSHSSAVVKTLPARLLTLSLWRLEQCGKVLYMDPGSLILRDIAAVFQIPFDRFLGSLDRDKVSPIAIGYQYHGDVFLLKPSLHIYGSLIESINTINSDDFKDPLPKIFEAYFAHDGGACCLPLEYNIPKTLVRYWPQFWNFSDTRILT